MKNIILPFLCFMISIMIKSSPVQVTGGGTGDVSLTAYAILAGGITTVNPVQSIASVGTLGQFLTSNGAGFLPTFQTNGLVFIKTATALLSEGFEFTSADITTTYKKYLFVFDGVSETTGLLQMDWSTDNGASYVATNFTSGFLRHPWNATTLTNATSAATCPLTSTTTGVSVGVSGYMIIYGLNGSTTNGPVYVANLVYVISGGAGTTTYVRAVGYNTGSLNVNNIKFEINSATVNGGTISLYGFAE